MWGHFQSGLRNFSEGKADREKQIVAEKHAPGYVAYLQLHSFFFFLFLQMEKRCRNKQMIGMESPSLELAESNPGEVHTDQ